jgi:hypothetical protein
MNINFSPTLLYNLKFHALAVHIGRMRKNTQKEVKLLNIAIEVKIVPNLSISLG